MPDVYKAGHKEESKGKKRSEGVFRSFLQQQTLNPLAAFALVPPHFKFEQQEQDEKIILLVRQHPVVNLPWIILAIVLVCVPSIWEFLPWAGLMPANFALMTVVLWYLMVIAFILLKFLDWYYNVYIITDERVVDIDFYGLLYKDMSVVKLDTIQQINYVQTGGVAAIFNYGDVYIQTAAEKRQLDFLRVPLPGKIVDILYKLIEEEEEERLEGRVK